jgi:pimeloyl-ACP methyl ester carboxylesterase
MPTNSSRFSRRCDAKVREADFIGLSAGGNIAAIVCARQPQRCRSLNAHQHGARQRQSRCRRHPLSR